MKQEFNITKKGKKELEAELELLISQHVILVICAKIQNTMPLAKNKL